MCWISRRGWSRSSICTQEACGPASFSISIRDRKTSIPTIGSGWLVVVGLGSGPGYADMERFGGTITDVAVSERVADALGYGSVSTFPVGTRALPG